MSKEIGYVEYNGFFFNAPAIITRGGRTYKVSSNFLFKDNASLSAKLMRDRGYKAFVYKQTGTKLRNAKVTKGGAVYFVYGCPPTEAERERRIAREKKAWEKKLERSR